MDRVNEPSTRSDVARGAFITLRTLGIFRKKTTIRRKRIDFQKKTGPREKSTLKKKLDDDELAVKLADRF